MGAGQRARRSKARKSWLATRATGAAQPLAAQTLAAKLLAAQLMAAKLLAARAGAGVAAAARSGGGKTSTPKRSIRPSKPPNFLDWELMWGIFRAISKGAICALLRCD